MARTKISPARSCRARREPRWVVAASALLVALVSARAGAQEPGARLATEPAGLVIVVRTPPPRGFPEAEERVRAELVASGLAVELRASEAEDAGALADDVRGKAAFAALRLLRGELSSVVLTIAAVERKSGQVRLYDFPLGEPGSPMTAARAGLLVSEHLYALRQEIRWPVREPPAAPTAAVAAASAAPEPPPSRARPASLRLGATAWAIADTVRPAVTLGGAAAVARGPAWALLLDGELGATPLATPISAAAGSSDVRFGTARVGLALTRATSGRWSPFALVGAGVLAAHATAQPIAPHVGRDDDAVVGLAALELGAAVSLSRAFALRLAACATRAWPPMRIELGEARAARIGAPVLVGASVALAWSAR